jgi:hypothetical protein
MKVVPLSENVPKDRSGCPRIDFPPLGNSSGVGEPSHPWMG